MFTGKAALNTENRLSPTYDNELHLYKARVYANCQEGDDRLQVRIIPYMNGILSTELDNLPKYPSLIKGQIIKVKTEKDDTIGDLVWVVATPDFTMGYILGPANVLETAGDQKPKVSWGFTGCKDILRVCNSVTDEFEYKNIMVDLQNNNGTLIEFHNIKSGEKWTITSTGDMIHIKNHKIFLQAASGTGIDDDRSNITIEPNKISVNTGLFEVNAKKILLGKHNMHLLASLSDPSDSISCDGMNLQPIGNILV